LVDLEVAELPRRAVDKGSGVLVRAFAGDPILAHLLRGPATDRGHPAFFRSIIWEHLDGRGVYGAWDGRQLVGVIVWSPPEGIVPSVTAGRRAAVARRLVTGLYPQGMHDVATLFDRLGSLHPPEPHWYLAFVGVEPGRHGQGIGSRLLRPVVDLADQTSTPCYLETPAAATLPFYHRAGFEVVSEERPIPGLDVPVWTMLRTPRVG